MTDTETYTPPPLFVPLGLKELKTLLDAAEPARYVEVYDEWTRSRFDADRWLWTSTKHAFLRLRLMRDDDPRELVRAALLEDMSMHAKRAVDELCRKARILGAVFALQRGEEGYGRPCELALQRAAVAHYARYVAEEEAPFGATHVQMPPDCELREADALDMRGLVALLNEMTDKKEAYKRVCKSLTAWPTRSCFADQNAGEPLERLQSGMEMFFDRRIARATALLEDAAYNVGFALTFREVELGGAPVRGLRDDALVYAAREHFASRCQKRARV
jgi:hypothetical protein